jgi:hypothetical protein
MSEHLSDKDRLDRLEKQVGWLMRQVRKILKHLGLSDGGDDN